MSEGIDAGKCVEIVCPRAYVMHVVSDPVLRFLTVMSDESLSVIHCLAHGGRQWSASQCTFYDWSLTTVSPAFAEARTDHPRPPGTRTRLASCSS